MASINSSPHEGASISLPPLTTEAISKLLPFSECEDIPIGIPAFMLCVKANPPSRSSQLNIANIPIELRFCIFDRFINLPRVVEWDPWSYYNRRHETNHTHVMRVSKQFHKEFAHLLYSSRTFSFCRGDFITHLFDCNASVGRYLSQVEIGNFNDNYEDLWHCFRELGPDAERLTSVTMYHDDVCHGSGYLNGFQGVDDTWVWDQREIITFFLRLVKKHAMKGKGAEEAVEVLRIKDGKSTHYGASGLVDRCRLNHDESIGGRLKHVKEVEQGLRGEIIRLYELWEAGGLGDKMMAFSSIEYHEIVTREIVASVESETSLSKLVHCRCRAPFSKILRSQ